MKSPPQERGYRRLEPGPGEPHVGRHELTDKDADGKWSGHGETLARLIHITDFQLADLASPSRVEFLQRLTGQPAWRRMLPAYRPQEFMLTQAVEAVVRTVRRESEEGRVDFVVTTGDNTDSAQENELATYLTLMNGGDIDPGHDNGGLAETVTCSGDPAYWNPEPASADTWKQEYGYPDYPGAVAAAAKKFTGAGLGAPWLTCFGNHDCLVQGRARAQAGYDDFLTANRKPVALPARPYNGADALNDYCEDPLWVSQGPSMSIEASPERRMVSKKEYIERHFETTGVPEGHGFTAENISTGTAYYAYDGVPGLRVISLDTTNPAGNVDGCVNEKQYRWLEDRLQEVHSTYLAGDGTEVSTGNEDRLVMICSHHGLSTMTNDTPHPDGEHLYLAPDVERLLHRFPNVVLWLSGHTHVNRITPRPRTGGGGFWEVSTSSVAEWPVQLRTVHFTVVKNAGVRIRTTMIDSAVPVTPTGGTDLHDLASLHREAAANDAGSVGGLEAEGKPADRNADLLVPLPSSTLNGLAGLIRLPELSLGTNQ
ncbi:TIGR03767 family metallophosphoesterase [Arthrobacter burdickii]|uniref:TIGR03767 family metallophosphoesterase n=1 Tax=Arthrobacter burdickii TaxID=3035920 RepID=A0ABT8JZE4_9MICC|nr:TIGR03767 family metallophosphoesterase [Arthrobacter burdickii]MDN4610138.1 TIGR03767 family metallophosphoesterase [Arthrobacter burdickii]